MSVTRFSRAIATSWVSVLSGGDSGESESFSLSSLLTLSFLFSARHFLLRLLCSCSQLGEKNKRFNCSQSNSWLGLFYYGELIYCNTKQNCGCYGFPRFSTLCTYCIVSGFSNLVRTTWLPKCYTELSDGRGMT